MVAPIVAIGGLALLLRKARLFNPKVNDDIDDNTPNIDDYTFTCVYPQIKMLNTQGTAYVCGLDPDFVVPQPVSDQFQDMDEFTWDAVYIAEGTGTTADRYVWKYGTLMGLLYDDGTDGRHYNYFYLIGNESHTSFTRESNGEYGHLFNGMAKVYADEAAAIAEANRLNEPADPNDPYDPTQPQGDDEEDNDDDDGLGNLPTQPSYSLGLGYMPKFGGI